MTDKGMAHPASQDRAGALRAEPQDASQAKPLIPCAVHVVTRRVGMYEYTETLVRAFFGETSAAGFVEKAAAEWRAAVDAVPDDVGYPPDNAPDAEWDKWKRRRKRAWSRFRALLTCDPDAAPGSEWESPNEPDYYSVIVPLDGGV